MGQTRTVIEWSDVDMSAVIDRWELLSPDAIDATLVMDLSAANGVNGNPEMDIEALMTFDDWEFAHDIIGIQSHMNRETGKLERFFRPRCAR